MNNYHNKKDFYQLFNIDKNDFSEGDLKKVKLLIFLIYLFKFKFSINNSNNNNIYLLY